MLQVYLDPATINSRKVLAGGWNCSACRITSTT